MLARFTVVAIFALTALAFGCDNDETPSSGAAPQYGESPTGAAVAADAPAEEEAAGDQQGRKRWDRPPAMQIDTSKTYIATIKTSMGDIKIELFDDTAPKTVNNFVFLARNDFYDGTIFHRVIDDFMIQGGDPTGTGMGDAGYKFEDETRGNPNKHEPFTMSMANGGPNTNGSQFFITEEQATPHLDGRHTVFGKVLEGQEVVSKIATVEKDRQDRPLEKVVIQDVVIEENSAEGEQPATKPATQPASE